MNTAPAPDDTKLFLTLEFNQVQISDKIPITATIRPDNNFIATPILMRLLDAILESVGQLVSPTGGGGPLNHSFFVCHVRDANTAAKTLWPLLQELRLDGGAKLYRVCESERILRCIFPAAGDIASWDEFLDTVHFAAKMVELNKARGEALGRLVERLKPTDPPGGDSK